MARIRTIKPDFFRHRRLYLAEQETGLPIRMAFAGLWTACDREGRFAWEPEELKLDCLPYDDVDFSRVLDALTTRGFVVRYASNGRDYGYVPGFQRHQVINNRESPSTIPPPPEDGGNPSDLTRAPRVGDACPTPLVQDQGEGKGKEGKGKKEGGADAHPETPFAWVGRIVRLTPSDLDDWRRSYSNIPDIMAELKAADDYYAEKHPKDGKWFFPVSNWLKRAHEQHKPKPRRLTL